MLAAFTAVIGGLYIANYFLRFRLVCDGRGVIGPLTSLISRCCFATS